MTSHSTKREFSAHWAQHWWHPGNWHTLLPGWSRLLDRSSKASAVLLFHTKAVFTPQTHITRFSQHHQHHQQTTQKKSWCHTGTTVFHYFITHNFQTEKETEMSTQHGVQQSRILGVVLRHFGDWKSHRVGGGGHVMHMVWTKRLKLGMHRYYFLKAEYEYFFCTNTDACIIFNYFNISVSYCTFFSFFGLLKLVKL